MLYIRARTLPRSEKWLYVIGLFGSADALFWVRLLDASEWLCIFALVVVANF